MNEKIVAMKYRERATLVLEAEELMSEASKNNDILFPNYILIREKAAGAKVRGSYCYICDKYD